MKVYYSKVRAIKMARESANRREHSGGRGRGRGREQRKKRTERAFKKNNFNEKKNDK